ncbi:hypothetical protein EBR21_07395, partial [bacterium]|nr:hypothetical protein [bacterium]
FSPLPARIKILAFAALATTILNRSQTAEAVPTSILLQPTGTQADVQWGRVENDRFVVYYDASQKSLATHAMKSVERAYPDLSLLLGASLKGQPPPPELSPDKVLTSNFEKIPVIVSARSDGPSFANLISQSIEIQSSEAPPAALFQHELSHRIMYEHMDLNVGPAGRTFMLAMLPSWWTEGLPEYLTESLGRIETNGYLRAMALNDTFLSWDRLHALYKASGDVSVRGYALSGRFFKYFLDKTPNRNLRELHSKLTWRQLIPPFFSGAYFLIHSLTGSWPGDLYESFKKDLRKQILADLEGMPRLEKMTGASKIFSSVGGFSFAISDKTFVQTDFATPGRAGGLVVHRFADGNKTGKAESFLQPLNIMANDRIVVNPKEWSNGGFWTSQTVKGTNRTSGQMVSYYSFYGLLDELTDAKISGRVDFQLGNEATPPSVQRIVSIAPQNAAVLTSLNTETKLYLLNTNLRQHTLLGQWRAPDNVALVRPHHAHPESESTLCAHVIVNHDDERTSLERLCHGESVQTIIPEGQFYIRDAVMLAPDDFVLLTGWNNAQALVRWTKGKAELITGLADFVTSIEPGDQPESLMLRVYTGGNMQLWRASLKDLRKSYLGWIITRPEKSKWWKMPQYIPYEPPFARYARAIRKNAGTYKEEQAALLPPLLQVGETKKTLKFAQSDVSEPKEDEETPDLKVPSVEVPAPEYLPKLPDANAPKPAVRKSDENRQGEVNEVIEEPDPETNSTISIPAPYRFRHWMTYPNALPPFLAGVWTFGFFSRPFVDEMERFYLQLFGTYYYDPDIAVSDRLALEANMIGNRLFDGWKGNIFMRPRFNGLTGCRFANDPKTYVCQLYLREVGADLQLNRQLDLFNANSDVHARMFQISPSSRGANLGVPALGAQDAFLISAGGTMVFETWKKTLFDAPVEQLNKRDIGLGGSLRLGVDTTHSLGTANSGDGRTVSPVSFQNYSLEFTNSGDYRGHSLTLRNSYSSTGGGAPLNAKEFFRPFKTYIIGANDGLQDISTALAGNGLLSYSLTGRAQYRNSLSWSFPIIQNLDTRLAIAYLEKLDGEIVLSRGGTSNDFYLGNTDSISTITGSMRMKIDVKGYQFNPAILYGVGIDKPLWQLFTQIKFDQFW